MVSELDCGYWQLILALFSVRCVRPNNIMLIISRWIHYPRRPVLDRIPGCYYVRGPSCPDGCIPTGDLVSTCRHAIVRRWRSCSGESGPKYNQAEAHQATSFFGILRGITTDSRTSVRYPVSTTQNRGKPSFGLFKCGRIPQLSSQLLATVSFSTGGCSLFSPCSQLHIPILALTFKASS